VESFLILGIVFEVILFRWKWSLYFILLISLLISTVLILIQFASGALIYVLLYTMLSLIGVGIVIGIDKLICLKLK
jgi:hypothetical protein